MRTYKEYVFPAFIEGVTPIIYPSEEKVRKVEEFIVRLANEKQGEQHHQTDATQRMKRFYTGFIGEAALEQLFGVEFMDTTVGESSKYRESDLKKLGLDVGVKTVRYESNKFPLINRNIMKPQVMCMTHGPKVIVFGLATVPVLRDYSDDSLVITEDAKGRKTGFYGFHKLKAFRTLAELRSIVSP